MYNTKGNIYIHCRRPDGKEKNRSDGSPSNAALHRNIPINTSGNAPNTAKQISRRRVQKYLQQPSPPRNVILIAL